ncbi:protein tyrosine phosphatase [Corynebacterium maris DSM 45190]|uniref:Protein tyrosine phosphatase n=1 Tax=Corynebacterium maris DSM 45190 TaxID=1224163 RepID=S5SVU4_9CORY|nr:protein tyrosine phosphatase [Corynebacterium maris DSM 45190]
MMDSSAAAQLAARDVDANLIDAFRSRPLTAAAVARAGLVLCMEDAHAEAVVALTPAAADKTFTVLELAEIVRRHPGGSWRDLRRLRQGVLRGDVADPFGHPESEFALVAECIEDALTAIAGWEGWDEFSWAMRDQFPT